MGSIDIKIERLTCNGWRIYSHSAHKVVIYVILGTKVSLFGRRGSGGIQLREAQKDLVGRFYKQFRDILDVSVSFYEQSVIIEHIMQLAVTQS